MQITLLFGEEHRQGRGITVVVVVMRYDNKVNVREFFYGAWCWRIALWPQKGERASPLGENRVAKNPNTTWGAVGPVCVCNMLDAPSQAIAYRGRLEEPRSMANPRSF